MNPRLEMMLKKKTDEVCQKQIELKAYREILEKEYQEQNQNQQK